MKKRTEQMDVSGGLSLAVCGRMKKKHTPKLPVSTPSLLHGPVCITLTLLTHTSWCVVVCMCIGCVYKALDMWLHV